MKGLYLVALLAACLYCGQSVAAEIRIHDIQGRAHISPLQGEQVNKVRGIVTALRPQGFYMQDDAPDQDEATSEAIFVFTQSAAGVVAGDAVEVDGTVAEFRPGGAAGLANLSSTNLVLPTVIRLSSANALPPPIMLGKSGRMPPNRIKAADIGDVEASKDFDPALNALDFYESLEGMRVRVTDAQVVAPMNGMGEIAVISEGSGQLSPRGALLIDAQNFNPQRLLLAQAGANSVKVGDHLEDASGVLDYGFGQYKLYLNSTPLLQRGILKPESARAARADELSIACYNVENLDGRDLQLKFDRIAAHIVGNLQAPDILGLLEVQDSNGAINDRSVDATQTLNRLTQAIKAAGGPAYAWTSIDPINNEDGGEPGANIRQVFLFNPARVGLASKPLRIAPESPAFYSSRKPLLAVFNFDRQPLYIVLNHFVSKRGDEPLFGLQQAPRRFSEAQRHRQARAVADYIRGLNKDDLNVRVVVMGDLNDFEFSTTLNILEDAGLHNLTLALPPAERYSYIHEGNAQALDHVLVSDSLSASSEYDIVHVNAEFSPEVRPSDHDPVLLRLRLP